MINPHLLRRLKRSDCDMPTPSRALDCHNEELTLQIPMFVSAITLNGEYLPFTQCPADTRKYPSSVPLEANNMAAIQGVIKLLETAQPGPESCVKAIIYTVSNGAFMLKTEFNPKTKCTNWMSAPSEQTKTNMCRKFACAGECIDQDMRKIFARILPNVYGTTQR